jgi:RNA polymerase sigma-70 factor (ECF subfamily)
MSSYEDYTDEMLILLLKSGDELAFTEIYRRHWHMLYLHAKKVLADGHEAKDLVQDLFFSLWTKAAALDVKTNLKGYLYVMARNRVLNLLRQKKQHDFVELIAEELEAQDVSLLQAISQQELAELIDAEIARLPPKMRLVFELSRRSFLTHKEIAERLDMNEEAVKKQISRSLKLLKLKLGHYSGFFLLL